MEDSVDCVPKVKIEIILNDEMVIQVVNAVKTTPLTGNKGDGKIFIHDVCRTIRIMTGETGKAAV